MLTFRGSQEESCPASEDISGINSTSSAVIWDTGMDFWSDNEKYIFSIPLPPPTGSSRHGAGEVPRPVCSSGRRPAGWFGHQLIYLTRTHSPLRNPLWATYRRILAPPCQPDHSLPLLLAPLSLNHQLIF
ncbi:hypothetical protein J6590_095792 [Homalodisca vitripennis]|nr:hypothetical protein J6590_095792 [Homalodisca vitripennis]